MSGYSDESSGNSKNTNSNALMARLKLPWIAANFWGAVVLGVLSQFVLPELRKPAFGLFIEGKIPEFLFDSITFGLNAVLFAAVPLFQLLALQDKRQTNGRNWFLASWGAPLLLTTVVGFLPLSLRFLTDSGLLTVAASVGAGLSFMGGFSWVALLGVLGSLATAIFVDSVKISLYAWAQMCGGHGFGWYCGGCS
jgi:hypothetical protein